MPEDTRTSAAPVIIATRRNLCGRLITLPLLRRRFRRRLLLRRLPGRRPLARRRFLRGALRRACRRGSGALALHALRQLRSARLAVPLFEGLVGNLPVDQQLRKLAPLRLALERHASLLSVPNICHGRARRTCRATAAPRCLRTKRLSADSGQARSREGALGLVQMATLGIAHLDAPAR